METSTKVKILSSGAVAAMLRRMAYEIYEHNFQSQRLVMAGIGQRGGFLADRLEAHLREISPLHVVRMDLAKNEDGSGLQWLGDARSALEGETLLIVDDVLYSGATTLQALVLAAGLKPETIQTAFLIDRGHHHFPVRHDYVGMEMATSLKQYVSVEVDPQTLRAEAFIF